MVCRYATKYCHSLKLHLRKYGHKPAMVLNNDGSPNALPAIDMYGGSRYDDLPGSVADPDPHPDPDPYDPYHPYVFGPPGSAVGSISQRYGSSSGSFYHQAKIVRKTLILIVL